jgi:three-Cys-motif partner protein
MAKDINKAAFSEATLRKLDIFAECFREWFPVFVHNPYIKDIFIIDFFAGSGMDSLDNFGSPLRLLNEAKGIERTYCSAITKNDKKVCFVFNENNKQKKAELEINVRAFMSDCKKDNCNQDRCIYDYENFEHYDFKDIFNNDFFAEILKDGNFAKFILLDQYGFSQVDEAVFLKLVDSPHTDFIFFISSSFIKRFKEVGYTKKYFDTERIPFDESNPKECHRLIADYFEKLVPQGKEYYLHHFSIKKDHNYYGLIFGTNHTLGMEKFLRVCWKHDKFSGESDFNIDNDYPEDSLFFTRETTNKIEKVKNEIKNKILTGEITDNIRGLKFTLKKRCLPEVFVSVISDMEKNKQVKCFPKINRQAANIHKADHYQIEVLTK